MGQATPAGLTPVRFDLRAPANHLASVHNRQEPNLRNELTMDEDAAAVTGEPEWMVGDGVRVLRYESLNRARGSARVNRETVIQ